MEKFLEQINIEAERYAENYMDKGEIKDLEEVNLRLSILAHAQALKTSSLTADFTKTMEDRMKDIDFSKLDVNDLIKQMGNMNGKI